MRTTEYQCGECKLRKEVTESVHAAVKDTRRCECGGKFEWAPTFVPLGRFKYDPSKAGQDTGVYEYDYGVRATWDLTVPGKMDKLTRQGRIAQDPFDEFDSKVKKGEVKPYASSQESL